MILPILSWGEAFQGAVGTARTVAWEGRHQWSIDSAHSIVITGQLEARLHVWETGVIFWSSDMWNLWHFDALWIKQRKRDLIISHLYLQRFVKLRFAFAPLRSPFTGDKAKYTLHIIPMLYDWLPPHAEGATRATDGRRVSGGLWVLGC